MLYHFEVDEDFFYSMKVSFLTVSYFILIFDIRYAIFTPRHFYLAHLLD